MDCGRLCKFSTSILTRDNDKRFQLLPLGRGNLCVGDRGWLGGSRCTLCGSARVDSHTQRRSKGTDFESLADGHTRSRDSDDDIDLHLLVGYAHSVNKLDERVDIFAIVQCDGFSCGWACSRASKPRLAARHH